MEEYDQTELKFEHNGEEYLLRRWRLEDVEDAARHANSEKVSAGMSNRFLYPYTEEHAEEVIRSKMKEFVLSKDDSKDPMMRRYSDESFAIVYVGKEKSEVFGGIHVFFKDDTSYRVGVLGYWIGEQYWGKGIVKQVIKTIMNFIEAKYVNGPLGNVLDKVKAGVYHENIASMKVLEQNGFVLEGVFKKEVHKRGKHYDMHWFAKFFEPSN
jgi:ribosomal-protein-alanine N-acetyltransferase